MKTSRLSLLFSQSTFHLTFLVASLSALAQPASLDPSFKFATCNVYPSAVAVQKDARILIGGVFITVNGQARAGLARLNADGTLDEPFNTGKGPQVINPAIILGGVVLVPAGTNAGAVNGIDVQTDGRILMAGNFNYFNGVTANNIARLNADGSLDGTFVSGSGLADGGNFVKVLPSGKILVAGGSKYNGTAVNLRLLRINPDGSLDSTFKAPVLDLGGSVSAVTVQSDGKIVAAASYLNSSFKLVTQIIRMSENGALDAGFTRGSVVGGVLARTAVQPSGKILVAGSGLTTYEGIPVKNLFRLNPDGSLDSTFDASATGSSILTGMLAQSDGQILVSGQLPQNQNLIRLHPDGAQDSGFSLPLGFGALGLLLQPDGKILVSGSQIVGVAPVFGLYRLNGGASSAPTPPGISTPPASQTVNQGVSVSFTVVASGVGPFTYQWKHDDKDVPGATGATLTIPRAQTTDAGKYAAVVSNATGSTTSTTATLTVNVPAVAPAITVQPKAQTALVGGGATFSVEATGTVPLKYQWQLNGKPITGATGATLALASLQLTDAGNYTVVVTNDAGSATSSVAALAVFANPPEITQQPKNLQVTLSETNLTAAILAGRVLTLTVQGGLPPWLSSGTYRVPLTATTYSSPARGGLATASAGSYTVQPDLGVPTVLFLNNYFTDGKQAKLALVGDGRFEIYADGLVANQNGHWTVAPAFTPAPGPTAVFNVVATGSAPLSYQWKLNGRDVPGETSPTLTIPNVQASNLGSYTVEVKNSGGSVTSTPALLSATPTGPVAGPGIQFSFTGGKTLTFNWPAGYALQSTDRLISPQWTDVPGAPPQNIPTETAGRFFRLISR